MKLKFGDIVTNGWAEKGNPWYALMVIEVKNGKVKCLNLKGKTLLHYDKDKICLTKVGSIDLSEWRRIADQTKTP